MSRTFIRVVRGISLAIMSALAIYELLILTFISFAALTPRPAGIVLAWVATIAELVACTLAFRFASLPTIAGFVDWIVNLEVFQFGEQHLGLRAAIQNSSLDIAFILSAVVFWVSVCTSRATQKKASIDGTFPN